MYDSIEKLKVLENRKKSEVLVSQKKNPSPGTATLAQTKKVRIQTTLTKPTSLNLI